MTELRDRIAAEIEPHIAEDDWAANRHLTIADAILDIPEIREALAMRAAWERRPRNVWQPVIPDAAPDTPSQSR